MSISKNVTSKSAVFNGLLKAKASERNPLQTVVSFILLDWLPNKNNQAVASTEKDNIINSGLFQPLKIDFSGNSVGGHNGAIPIGPITHIYDAKDGERDVLVAEAIVWNEEYDDIAEYLKKRTAENNPVGQSWELLFEDSSVDDNGVEWLHGCLFSAACLVNNPAYGNTRTRILSVAEDISNKSESELMEEERTEISNLQQMLSSMFGMLDDLYYKTYEIEEAEIVQTDNLDGFSSRLNDLVTRLTNRANDAGVALAETQTNLETLQGKLTDLQAELDELKAEKAKAELDKKLAERKTLLSEAGVEVDEIEKLIALDDTAFELFVSTVKQVKSKSTAESKVKINLPDPISIGEVDNSVVIESHNSLYKRGK